MTLTPAIKEALNRLYASLRCDPCFGRGPDSPCPVCGATGEEESTLLSVVAAEEGRKYEALVGAVKEWKTAATEEAYRVACQKLAALSLEVL